MPTPVTLFGLANCDTTRKARQWLDAKHIVHSFHDVRADGVTRVQLEGWAKALGWEKLLNKASTTWRELPNADKAGVDAKKAVAMMLAHPTLIKRPVVDNSGKLLVGFKPEAWTEAFA